MFVSTLDHSSTLTADDRHALLDCQVQIETSNRRGMLANIAAQDRDELWKQDGAFSMREWLSFKYGHDRDTADELVRVAHAVEFLPAIGDAFGEGHISWDKLVALCGFATPDEDAALAEYAQTHSVFAVKHLARWRRRRTRELAERALARRYARCRWDPDGSMRLNARLPAAEGAIVRTALERVAEKLPPEPDGTYPRSHTRNADALVEICSAELAEDADSDRALVMVHVDAKELNHINGSAELHDGPSITTEIARRLACDGRLQLVADGADGKPIGVGRVTRSVLPWLVRQLRRRDRGCRFADCGRTRGLHAHHVVHWAHGGRTDLENLVLLCPFHHRPLHEGTMRMGIAENGGFIFMRKDGRVIETSPISVEPGGIERRNAELGLARSFPCSVPSLRSPSLAGQLVDQSDGQTTSAS